MVGEKAGRLLPGLTSGAADGIKAGSTYAHVHMTASSCVCKLVWAEYKAAESHTRYCYALLVHARAYPLPAEPAHLLWGVLKQAGLNAPGGLNGGSVVHVPWLAGPGHAAAGCGALVTTLQLASVCTQVDRLAHCARLATEHGVHFGPHWWACAPYPVFRVLGLLGKCHWVL